MLDPPKKYFRLAPGRTVRLRGGYCITCTDYKQDAEGTITEIFCEHIPGHHRHSNPPEGIQCPRRHSLGKAPNTRWTEEIRIYDRLFTEENPDAAEEGFLFLVFPSESLIADRHHKTPSWNPPWPEPIPEFPLPVRTSRLLVADRRDHVPGTSSCFQPHGGSQGLLGKKTKITSLHPLLWPINFNSAPYEEAVERNTAGTDDHRYGRPWA